MSISLLKSATFNRKGKNDSVIKIQKGKENPRKIKLYLAYGSFKIK